ncbi:MAG: L-threonylcarbamoyladenylate synthase [Alphaproteobacteria bacterium]|nr:L-threonylcarbamoyladenylate synthase [Alphaproteobacteria bacterium]
MARIVTPTPQSIEEAARILRDGGLVAIPTETVYGLAADARNGTAVAKVFKVKGRPSFNPLIVHVNSVQEASRIAGLSDKERIIAQNFWPGPLTMILKRRSDSGLSDLVTAGLDTVAVRVPTHKTARDLIKACGFPIAAPSANISGSLSPTTPAHVAKSLGDKIDLILADGACKVGLESTVLDCSGEHPLILRPGGISAEEIARILGEEVSYDLGATDTPKSPGQLLKHYAPECAVRLNAIDLEEGEALLAFGSIKFMGMKGGGAASSLPDTMIRNLSESGDLYEAASNLFAMLRDLDKPEHKRIAVMAVPEKGIGIAINDRLKRAASG